MKRRMIQLIIGTVILLLCFFPCLAQAVTIHAGNNQMIVWDETHTAKLDGSVSPAELKVKWSCPQHSDVIFKKASDPRTEVTFPRPGYYQLILSSKDTNSSVIVNVLKPGSYKDLSLIHI